MFLTIETEATRSPDPIPRTGRACGSPSRGVTALAPGLSSKPLGRVRRDQPSLAANAAALPGKERTG